MRLLVLSAILVVAGALAYANSISRPFLFDDMLAVVDNRQIRDLSDWSAILHPESGGPVSERPLVNLSFAINYAIGGLNVAGYHVWNITVHLLCGLVLFALVRRTLELRTREVRLEPDTAYDSVLKQHSASVAFAAALIWTLHPLNTEAVTHVTQRTESMMALFYLLTLYASLRGTTRWQWIAVLSCLAGMVCKESMVTAPLMVMLFDRVFIFDSFREAWRKRWRLYGGLASTWLLLAAVVSMGPRPRLSAVLAGVGPWTYLLNQPPILVRYLRLTVWPQSLVLLYGWPREVTLNDVLPSAIFIVALLILTIVGLRFRPQLAFLGAWCWIILAPTSTIVPMVTEVGAERRMYLPLAGLVVLYVVGAALIWDKLRTQLPTRMQSSNRMSIGAAFLLVAISASLASATVVRNREYSSPLEMAETILDRYPTPLAHQVMGTTLLEVGRRDEAMTQLRQALPDIPRAHYFIGVQLLKDGKVDEGIAELQAFVRDQPPYLADVVDARGHLGTAFAQQERWPEAISEFLAVLKIVPGSPMTELLLAEALFSAGRWNESIVHYRAYLDSDPNDAGALNNVGVALASNGSVDDASEFFQRALAIDATFGAAERNLASALASKRDFDQALGHAQRAVTLQPDDAVSHYVLGLVLKGQDKRVEARAEFARAIELDPALDAARQSLQELR